jgi:hypothetical protein
MKVTNASFILPIIITAIITLSKVCSYFVQILKHIFLKQLSYENKKKDLSHLKPYEIKVISFFFLTLYPDSIEF